MEDARGCALIQPSFSLITVAFALISTYLSIRFTRNRAGKLNLMDYSRSKQKGVAVVGGIGIISSFFISSVLLFFFKQEANIFFILTTVSIITAVGVIDDLKALSVKKRFAIESITILLFVLVSGLQLRGLYGIWGIHAINPIGAVALSVLVFTFLINAINLIDGLDGLSGSLCFISIAYFCYIFFLRNDPVFFYLSLSVLSSLLVFLYFNRPKATVYLGDAGSLSLGFLTSCFAIRFIQSSPADILPHSPILAISVLIIPIHDTLFVFVHRLLKRGSPFAKDRLHLHYRLKDAGYSTPAILIIALSLTLACTILTTVVLPLGFTINFILLNLLCFSILWLLRKGLTLKKQG